MHSLRGTPQRHIPRGEATAIDGRRQSFSSSSAFCFGNLKPFTPKWTAADVPSYPREFSHGPRFARPRHLRHLGAKGIGARVAKVLAAEGAVPIIIGHNAADNAAAVAAIVAAGNRAFAAEAELTDTDACRQAVGRAAALGGRIDGLVNSWVAVGKPHAVSPMANRQRSHWRIGLCAAGQGKLSRYAVRDSAIGSCPVRANAQVHRLSRVSKLQLIELQPETRTGEQVAQICPPSGRCSGE